MNRTAAVITVSTRASQGIYEDQSGPLLVSGLQDLGYSVVMTRIVRDDVAAITAAIKEAVTFPADVVLTSGGTGISPTDLTPDATRTMLDRELPGIAEALRAYARADLPLVDLSRGLVGVCQQSLVINIAGSTGAARDALKVLAPILDHAIDQLRGGDHG